MSSLANKLKSSRNFLSGLFISSLISTSAFSAEPLKISPDKYGAWNTPVKVEMTETKLNYDVLEKRKVPLYLYGEKNEAEKSVTITYSTFPQNENMPNNPLQINTLDSKFYILKPAEVEIKIEQGDWSNFRGKLVASKLKEKQPISLEKLLLDATEKGIDFLRQADPIQAFSDGLDSSGKLGNEASIYGIINKLCSGQDEKYKKTLQEKYAGELELVKVDLKSNDSGAIYPRVGKMVKTTISGNYSGAKIPLIISQQIALGNTSQGLRGENPFFGQLETIAEFEFDNPNTGKATTPSTKNQTNGKYIAIITQNPEIPDPQKENNLLFAIANKETKKIIIAERNFMFCMTNNLSEVSQNIYRINAEQFSADINLMSKKIIVTKSQEYGNKEYTWSFTKIEENEKILNLIFTALDKKPFVASAIPYIKIEPIPDPKKEPNNIFAILKCEKNQRNISLVHGIFFERTHRHPASIEATSDYATRIGWKQCTMKDWVCPSGGTYIQNDKKISPFFPTCTTPEHKDLIN
jgi:hypothetical protein